MLRACTTVPTCEGKRALPTRRRGMARYDKEVQRRATGEAASMDDGWGWIAQYLDWVLNGL